MRVRVHNANGGMIFQNRDLDGHEVVGCDVNKDSIRGEVKSVRIEVLTKKAWNRKQERRFYTIHGTNLTVIIMDEIQKEVS